MVNSPAKPRCHWPGVALLEAEYGHAATLAGLREAAEAVRTGAIPGTELAIAVNMIKNLELYANHTLLFGERQREDPRTLNLVFVTDDGLIPFTQSYVYHLAPNNVLRLGATWTLANRYTVNLETTYVDSRDIDESFYEVEKSSLSPYWTTDLNLTAQGLLLEHLDVAVHLRNIFDEEYEYRGEQELFEGPDRSAFLELRWHF